GTVAIDVTSKSTVKDTPKRLCRQGIVPFALVACGPNAALQARGTVSAPASLRLFPVACRVRPMVTHPAPPQTRTGAMHASGSSSRAAAAPMQSTGVLWSGLVSSMSLPYVPPADALLDGAFPPVGRLGLTSPPSSVLCSATTAALPVSGGFACRSPPRYLACFRVFVVSP